MNIQLRCLKALLQHLPLRKCWIHIWAIGPPTQNEPSRSQHWPFFINRDECFILFIQGFLWIIHEAVNMVHDGTYVRFPSWEGGLLSSFTKLFSHSNKNYNVSDTFCQEIHHSTFLNSRYISFCSCYIWSTTVHAQTVVPICSILWLIITDDFD